MSDMHQWDQRFLSLAELVASWSKDPSTKCGAVIADGNLIISVGYNGFPKRLKDHEALYAHRPSKYERIIHAEMNAILYAHGRTHGMTLYTWPLAPCDRCAAHVIQAGIARVVTRTVVNERWRDAHKASAAMFNEAGMRFCAYD